MRLRFKILVVFLVLVGVWVFLAPLLADNLIVERPIEKADAIMVLSGSSVYTERVQKAAEVYKKGISDKILLTDDGGRAGWSKKEQRNPPFVDLAKLELISQGVNEQDIQILSPQVTGTIYEARILRRKIDDEKWDSVLLVTSAYHTKRTLWTFDDEIERVDVEIGIVSPPTGQQTPTPQTWWLTPRGWNLVAGEYVKFVVYWMFY